MSGRQMSKYAPQHSTCQQGAHGNRQRINARPWLRGSQYLSAGGFGGLELRPGAPPAADLSESRCIISTTPALAHVIAQRSLFLLGKSYEWSPAAASPRSHSEANDPNWATPFVFLACSKEAETHQYGGRTNESLEGRCFCTVNRRRHI